MPPKKASSRPKSASKTKPASKSGKPKRPPSAFAKFLAEFRKKNTNIDNKDVMKVAAADPEWKKIQAKLAAARKGK